jgi:SAM-dependent methyltransferase
MDVAAVGAGEAVLDVGCGTGATLLRLAELAGPAGQVLGCDVSAPMLALARQRAAGIAHVGIMQADAQAHRFPAAAFDAVVSRFGVMFFADPVAAFANLRQALRPGGRVAFVCWAPLADNPFFRLPMQAAVRRLGPVEPAPPRAPGPMAFGEPDYVREILAGAGYHDIVIDERRPDLLGLPTPAATADFVCEMGPVARLIAERQADGATAAAVHADIAEAFAAYQRDGRVRIPCCLYIVRARRDD